MSEPGRSAAETIMRKMPFVLLSSSWVLGRIAMKSSQEAFYYEKFTRRADFIQASFSRASCPLWPADMLCHRVMHYPACMRCETGPQFRIYTGRNSQGEPDIYRLVHYLFVILSLEILRNNGSNATSMRSVIRHALHCPALKFSTPGHWVPALFVFAFYDLTEANVVVSACEQEFTCSYQSYMRQQHH